MRAVVQRVSSARVTVEGEIACTMEEGLLALIGVARGDSVDAARELARRLVHLRIFNDAEGRMNHSLIDRGGTLGLVSQFTLFGDARHGRRPSFVEAAPAPDAEPLLAELVDAARSHGVTVVTGRFRAMMEVALVNSGPVTILLDTDKRF